jgi:hypothetical protein
MDNPITFYMDLPLEELQLLEDKLKGYIEIESRYLIAHEISGVTKKSHFHFVVEMHIDQYSKFRDAVIKKHYKLTKGSYGKVNNIRDVNKLLSYCLKDDGERRTNLEPAQVDEFIKKSFKRPEEKDHIENCLQKMSLMPYQYEYTDTDILCKKICILDYFKSNELDCNFKKVDRIWNMYLMRQKQLTANQVYELMRQTYVKKI